MIEFSKYESFGRYPKILPKNIKNIEWKDKLFNIIGSENEFLPRGFGKSYGDSCLIEDGTLIDTTNLNHLISFDENENIENANSQGVISTLIEAPPAIIRIVYNTPNVIMSITSILLSLKEYKFVII